MNKKAFTLIELIIVIAIVAILAAAIFVAVDPARRLHESRNARRWSDVSTILEAVKKFQVDNGGTHYSEIAGVTADRLYMIGTFTGSCAMVCASSSTQTDCIDLSDIGANYMAVVPVDPGDGTEEITGYALEKKADNDAITIYACDPEGEGAGGSDDAPEINVTR